MVDAASDLSSPAIDTLDYLRQRGIEIDMPVPLGLFEEYLIEVTSGHSAITVKYGATNYRAEDKYLITVYDDGKVSSISSEGDFVVAGRQIIGMTEDEVASVLGSAGELMEDFGSLRMFEYPESGIILAYVDGVVDDFGFTTLTE